MGSEHRKQYLEYLAGAVLTLAMAAFMAVVLARLGHSDRQDLFLTDTADQRFGWRYEVLAEGRVQAYEPEFTPDGSTLLLPEGTEAVRIERTMTEDVPDAELEWIDKSVGRGGVSGRGAAVLRLSGAGAGGGRLPAPGGGGLAGV